MRQKRISPCRTQTTRAVRWAGRCPGPPPGCAEIDLFNPRKYFPPPRPKRAPWTAPGRSNNVRVRRERGPMQRSSPSQLAAEPGLPLVGHEPQEMLVAERTLIGGNHPRQVYRFQDHLVLETILHFRIILGLENADRGCRRSLGCQAGQTT